MEQLSNEIIPFENGNIVSEDEAYDQYFISSMNSKYKSPEVDNFDVSGNKEPTLGENIAEGVKAVGTAINDQEGTLDKIGEDSIKGMVRGSVKGASNALTSVAQTFGTVVDGVNDYVVKPVLNELGIKGSKRPFGGTEMNVEAVNKITSVINDLIPNFLKDPINEFANEPFNYETYGTIVEEVSKFGITAVPAAKIVGMMSSANAIVRGFAWGGIADYMSMNPEDPAIATFLVDYFETDREKLEPWARNAISVLEKHDTDGVITKRLKNMMEGTIAGGIAEGILPLVKGIISATSIVPWAKTVTPLVGGAGLTFSDDAEGSLFGTAVKAGIKKVVPNALAKNVDEYGFYSKGLEEAKLLKQDKGSGQQFKAMLLKAGVKQDEIEWSGLDEILSKDKVTKQEIIDQLENNKIILDEIELVGSKYGAGFNDYIGGMNFDRSFGGVVLDNRLIGNRKYSGEFKSTMTPQKAYGDDYLIENANQIKEDYNSSISELDLPMTDDRAMEKAIFDYYEEPIRIYEDAETGFTITGNDEVGYSIFKNFEKADFHGNRLKTLNDDEPIYSFNEAQLQAESLARDSGLLEDIDGSALYQEYTLQGGDNYRELLLTFDNQGRMSNSKFKSNFVSPHFDQEGIIAHIRTKDRTYKGKKTLFIEEIQSDKGQEARKKGFIPSGKEKIEKEDNLKKGILELQEKYNEYTILKDGKQIPFKSWYEGFNLNSPQTVSQIKLMNQSFMDQTQDGYIYKNGKNIKGRDNIYVNFGNFSEMIGELQSQSHKLHTGLPKAPFITDTEKWTSLAIKRILSKASEEGYELVAITPGKVHFERWGEKGLMGYYDNIVPKVAKKVVSKLGGSVTKLPSLTHEIAVRTKGLDIDNEIAFDEALIIELSPEVKKKALNGQSMFAVPALVGVGASIEQDSNT